MYTSGFLKAYFLRPGAYKLSQEEVIDIVTGWSKLEPYEQTFIRLIMEGFSLREAARLIEYTGNSSRLYNQLCEDVARLLNTGKRVAE